MKNKRTTFLLCMLIIVLLFTLSGCIKYDQPLPSQDDNETQENIVADPKPSGEEKVITLYFMNKKIVETGQGEYSDMIKEERKVMVDDRPLEQIIIEELQNGPTSDDALTSLRKTQQIISVEVANKTAYVNLSNQNLGTGSLGEMGMIYQIVYSLTELDHVDKVQFLVEGKRRETLSGHFMVKDPLTRDMIQ